MTFADYLIEHAKLVPHMQTSFLLKAAAQELKKREQHVNQNWYIKHMPNGDFEVVYEDD